MRAYVHACARVRARARECMRTCMRTCVDACVHMCARPCERARERVLRGRVHARVRACVRACVPRGLRWQQVARGGGRRLSRQPRPALQRTTPPCFFISIFFGSRLWPGPLPVSLHPEDVATL